MWCEVLPWNDNIKFDFIQTCEKAQLLKEFKNYFTPFSKAIQWRGKQTDYEYIQCLL